MARIENVYSHAFAQTTSCAHINNVNTIQEDQKLQQHKPEGPAKDTHQTATKTNGEQASSEDQKDAQLLECTVEEVFVPPRHLSGLIPEGLTRDYCFWHSVDDCSIIRGYVLGFVQ
jgi:hypothetical protein